MMLNPNSIIYQLISDNRKTSFNLKVFTGQNMNNGQTETMTHGHSILCMLLTRTAFLVRRDC